MTTITAAKLKTGDRFIITTREEPPEDVVIEAGEVFTDSSTEVVVYGATATGHPVVFRFDPKRKFVVAPEPEEAAS